MNQTYKCLNVARSKIRFMSTLAKEPSTYSPYPYSDSVKGLPIPLAALPALENKQQLKRGVPPSKRALRRTRNSSEKSPKPNLQEYIKATLPSEQAQTLLSRYFPRRGAGRIHVGSVLTVTLAHPPYTFSGVLMSIRRKGPDSNILLRNIVRKTGIEMRIFLGSPTLLGMRIVQRAGGSKMIEEAPSTNQTAFKVEEDSRSVAKRMKRAKLYYLRDYPGKMSAISAGIMKKER